MAAVAILSVGTLGAVNLSLEPEVVQVGPGASFELELWARSDTPTSFDGAEVLVAWDPALVSFSGGVAGAGYAWSGAEFPAGSLFNNTWDDGDALYQCLSPLTGLAPTTDLLLATLEFTAGTQAASAEVNIPLNGFTAVGGAGGSVLGTVSGATIKIGSTGDGGGGGGPATNNPPVAVIRAEPSAGAAPLFVRFDATASSDPDGDALSFTWNLGDGQSGSGSTMEHRFDTAGTYAVVLVVNDGRGATASAQLTLTVSAASSDGGTTSPEDPVDDTPDDGGGPGEPGDVVAPPDSAGGDPADGSPDDLDSPELQPAPVGLCGAGAAQACLLAAGLLAMMTSFRRRP
jgi:hypothetical protein